MISKMTMMKKDQKEWFLNGEKIKEDPEKFSFASEKPTIKQLTIKVSVFLICLFFIFAEKRINEKYEDGMLHSFL